MTVRQYLMKVFDGMAKGLFASLIVGVIVKQIGVFLNVPLLVNIGQIAQYLMGPCIGIGVAQARGVKPFTLISAAVAGAIGAGMVKLSPEILVGIGEPSGAFISALCAIEAGKFIEGKTKFDILVVPIVVVTLGGIVGFYISPIISSAMAAVGQFINQVTLLQPIPMGIILGAVIGMILTLPISSAALCISINISGLAAGAALAGCCAQMVGFAVISYKENKLQGLIAQGIGTSMLQVPNIIKNPIVWLPPTIAGAVGGLLSTTVFKMETNAVGAGMGTSGLVGQITTISVMGGDATVFARIAFLHVLLPAVLSFGVYFLLKKKGLIKEGDLKL